MFSQATLTAHERDSSLGASSTPTSTDWMTSAGKEDTVRDLQFNNNPHALPCDLINVLMLQAICVDCVMITME